MEVFFAFFHGRSHHLRQDEKSDGDNDFEGEAVSFPVLENAEPGKNDTHRPYKAEQIRGKEKEEEVLLTEGKEKLGGVEDTEEARRRRL